MLRAGDPQHHPLRRLIDYLLIKHNHNDHQASPWHYRSQGYPLFLSMAVAVQHP